MTRFEEKDWEYENVRRSLKNANSKKEFKEKVKGLLVE
jgi:hypothetical protein